MDVIVDTVYLTSDMPHTHDQPAPCMGQVGKKILLKIVYVSKSIDSN